MIDEEVRAAWFCDEVLPLEAALTRFLGRYRDGADEVADMRHDIYERALNGAHAGLPHNTAAYVFAIARNYLINRAKRSRIIVFELVLDLEQIEANSDVLTPQRYATARDELKRAQEGIERLPARCREVIRLKKIEGLSSREVAARLGISVGTVDQHTSLGLRALVDFMLGGEGTIVRTDRKRPRRKEPAP